MQLAKEYGLILDIPNQDDEESQLTGFIVNEQKKSSKAYKQGAKVKCIVLDVDAEKKIVDLSERLVAQESADAKADDKKSKKEYQKAIVELNKDEYLIISLKNDRSKIGVCLLQSLSNNLVQTKQVYQKYSLGDEIEVKLVDKKAASEDGFLVTVPKTSQLS